MTTQTQEMNVATVTLDSIRKQDAEVVSLKEQLIAAKAEARIAKELADVRIKQYQQEEKSITVYNEDRWNGPKIVGTRNLESVIADLRTEAEKAYAKQITKLEDQLAAKNKEVDSLEDKLDVTKSDYKDQLEALRKENDLIKRANTLALEQEKLTLAEAHAKKLASFKEDKIALNARIAELQVELEKVKTDKTDEQLGNYIAEEMDKLRAENKMLRSRNPFAVRILDFFTRIKSTEPNIEKLRSAVRQKYNIWRF